MAGSGAGLVGGALAALPLFVVVVGVDPRWLLRSLQRHYRALLTSPGAERAASGDVSHWASMPQNYLEKIFQIPFALAPMTKAGFQRLVTDLATSTRRPTPADRQADAVEEPGPPPAPPTPSTSDQPEPPSPAPQAASATSDVDAATTLQAEDTTSAQRAGATVGPGDGGSRPSTSDPQLAERQQILVEEGSAASVEHAVDPNPRGLTLLRLRPAARRHPHRPPAAIEPLTPDLSLRRQALVGANGAETASATPANSGRRTRGCWRTADVAQPFP